jgi:4-hydroxy-4-methyl-2-oxoglutarate aldolase
VRVEHAFSRYREETAPGTRRPDAGLTVTQPGPQMIEEPPPLAFAPAHERPPAELVEALRGAPTSFIVDAMGGSGALDWRIKPIVGHSLLGVALTCDCGPHDNLALIAACAESQPGDVLVVATGSFAGGAVTGDLLLGVSRNRGVVGFVTDGLVRDLVDLETLGLPVYAMGVSPNSPGKSGPGTVGLPIVCGGCVVAAGDVVVGDRDGVVVVPRARLTETLGNLKQVKAAEAALLERVRGGLRELPVAPAARRPGSGA